MVVAPTTVVTDATFVVSGKITDDGEFTADWKLGDGPATPITVGAGGTFSVTVDTPLLDSQNVFISVTARDAHHEISVSKQLLIDRVAPTILVTMPTANSLHTGASTDLAVNTTGETAGVTGSIAGVQWNFQGGPTSWTAGSVTLPVLDFASLSLHIVARDAAGNTTAIDHPIMVDNAPGVTITAPAADSVHRTDITVTATTTGVVHGVTATLEGVTVPLTGGPVAWTGTIAVPQHDLAFNTLRVTAQESSGSSAFDEVNIGTDTVAPAVTIVAPAANSIHRTAITVSATTSAPADSVTATFEGVTVPLTGGPLAWLGTVAVPQHDYASSALRVTVRDAIGNSSFQDVVIATDTVAPVIAFTTPSAAQKFKASDFASSPNVTNAWTVTDADPQAATTTVNGAASTAVTVSVPTNATDNPASYMTTVAAADRAGNTATSSVSYSVDRVEPLIVSWTPALNARMVEPAESVITFSEPVFGATTTTPGLSLISHPQPSGDVWDLNHTRSLLPLATLRGRVVRLRAADLADSHGNSIQPLERSFHLATAIASGTLLASNVSTFAATADNDGVLTVAYLTTTGTWHFFADTGVLDTRSFGSNIPAGSKLAVTSWSTPAANLYAVRRWSMSLRRPTSIYRYYLGDGLADPVSVSSTAMGAIVTVPPLNREGATDPFGVVLGSTYTRGTFTRTFSTVADMITAQSADSWAVGSYSGTQVRWSRYRCNRDTQLFPGPATYTCGGTEYGGATSQVIDFAEAVMTRNGSCMLFNVRMPLPGGGFGYGGFAQPLENCDGSLGVSPPASCNPNTNIPYSSGLFGQKLAPFSLNGEHTILSAFPAGTGNPSEFRLEKMSPGTCSFVDTTFTPRFSVPNVRDYQPVQIGTKPAFIYVNTSNELRLYVP